MKLKLCAGLLAISGFIATACADPGDERILSAREAAGKGDLKRLSALAERPSSHVLESYVQYWALSARIARLTEPVPDGAVETFLHANIGNWLAEKLRNEWVRRLAYEKRWDEFENEYGLLMQPDQAAQCYAIQSGGRWADAARQALEAQWQTLLDLPDSCEAPMQELVAFGNLPDDAVWQRFRRQVEAKRLLAARMTLSWLPARARPNDAELKNALEKSASFLKSAAARKAADRTDRELVLAALAVLARSDVEEAAARWKSLENKAYTAEQQAYAWGQLGWRAATSRLPEAGIWFSRSYATEMSVEQRDWRVRASLRSSDWAGVRRAIEAMPVEQREAATWSYWMGRALRAQGRSQEAQQAFLRHADTPDFYGILATEALGRRFEWPKAAAPATAAELDRIARTPDIQRAASLYRLELRTEAAREWNWGLRGANDRYLLAAAEHARRLGMYDRAINTAERTRHEHDFGLRYLAPYYEDFARQARTNQLDLPWVFGLVRQESRFLSVARSGVGAQGLMQVMPATGKWIAKKQGWSDYERDWLTRIDTNIKVGSAYLRHVLDTLDNHPVLASAGYNAGPGRARRWRDVRALEGAIYAETIPFDETRGYVKKVMANAEIYATLIEGRPASLEQRLGTIPSSGSNDVALAQDEP